MPAKLKETKATEYKLEIELESQKTICVIARCPSADVWNVFLPEEKEFTPQQLIDICKAIYEAKIFDETSGFWLMRREGEARAKICGKAKITEIVLNEYRITFAGEKK